VVGPSGSGKTSLLNLLTGFEKPDSGSVEFQETSGNSILPFFWVPQDGGLWPHLNVYEHLRTVSNASESEIEEMLRAFDIEHISKSHPEELSQGERARLSTARALMTRARILVMDEPLVHVDQERRRIYWDRVRNMIKAENGSLVFSTHSPDTVLSEAEYVICLKEGRMLYSGDSASLYTRPETPELAACLGRFNWFETETRGSWVSSREGVINGNPCVRPENLIIEPAEQSHLCVESYKFKGPLSETEIRNRKTDEIRLFFHTTRRVQLESGMNVILKVLLSLVVIISMIGCSSKDDPVIRVTAEDLWNVPPAENRIPSPRAVAVTQDQNILVLDNAGRVLVYDQNGKTVRQWWMPEYSVGKPEGICMLRNGSIAVADTHYSRVVIFDDQGKVQKMFGSHGKGKGEFFYPVSVTQDDTGNIYVSEYGSNDRIQKFTEQGEYILEFGSFGTGQGQFQRASGILWHKGYVYVADAINNRIQAFTDNGKFISVLEQEASPLDLHFPYDIALNENSLVVIEYGAGRMTKIGLDGSLIGRYGTTGYSKGELRTPWGIASDRKGRIFIADTGNRRIVRLTL
jgi:ABC-type Fe3+/spermidine/putrescine transport system ATPase subunit/sugar lactone lactonase YvrE